LEEGDSNEVKTNRGVERGQKKKNANRRGGKGKVKERKRERTHVSMAESGVWESALGSEKKESNGQDRSDHRWRAGSSLILEIMRRPHCCKGIPGVLV